MSRGRSNGGGKINVGQKRKKIVLYHLNYNIGIDKCAKHFEISRG